MAALAHAEAPETHAIPVLDRRWGSWRLTLRRAAMDAPCVAAAYDRAAPSWAGRVARLGAGPAYEAVLREALAGAALGAPLRALDVGIGAGSLSLALARAAPGAFDPHGVDLSPAMLAEAGRRLAAEGVAARLREADARRLPFADGAFDVVMAAHVLEHLPDPAAALAEMARVTRPGGLVLVVLTRRSPLGLAIHLRWRTHLATPARAIEALAGVGLEAPRRLGVGLRGPFGHLSIACCARKPAATAALPAFEETPPCPAPPCT